MSDREEIRWKLTNIGNLIHTAKESHEKEQESLENVRNDVFQQLTQGRNTLVGGIGFGILLIISLISIDVLDKFYILIVPIGIVSALSLYAIFNLIIGRVLKKYYELDVEYQKQIIEILDFQGWFTGYSLREDVNNDQIMFMIYFVSVFANAVAYDIKLKSSEILGSKIPKIEEHSQYYEVIKENMEQLEKLNIIATVRIKKFIETIEGKEFKKK